MRSARKAFAGSCGAWWNSYDCTRTTRWIEEELEEGAHVCRRQAHWDGIHRCACGREWALWQTGVWITDRGDELGCPECEARSLHVCPFLVADNLPEPWRTWSLERLARQLEGWI